MYQSINICIVSIFLFFIFSSMKKYIFVRMITSRWLEEYVSSLKLTARSGVYKYVTHGVHFLKYIYFLNSYLFFVSFCGGMYVSRLSCCIINFSCSWLIQSWSMPWYCTFDSTVMVLCSCSWGLHILAHPVFHWLIFVSFSGVVSGGFLVICSDSRAMLCLIRSDCCVLSFDSCNEWSMSSALWILLLDAAQNAWYSCVCMGR